MKARTGAVGARSTAAVLWLMILLVFLPIAAAHVVARAVMTGDEAASGNAVAVVEGAPHKL